MSSEASTGSGVTTNDKNNSISPDTTAASSHVSIEAPTTGSSSTASAPAAVSSSRSAPAAAEPAAGTSSTAAGTSGTASMEGMTLRTLQQYRLMAADPAKVEPLTRDGTVAQFLAYVLEDRDEAIVIEALHTIILLCASSGSRKQLARTYGLEPALRCLKMKDSGAEVLALADRALSELHRSAVQPAAAAATRDRPRLPPRPKHKVVTLHVTGLVTDSDRDELESLLVVLVLVELV